MPKNSDLLIAASTIWVVVTAIADAARTGHVNGDGICWMSPVYAVTHNRTGRKLERVEVT